MRDFDYCERLDASFFAEPLNALSNLFFIIAAYLVYRYMRQRQQHNRFVMVLVGLMVLIGMGSFLWHTLATPLSELADVIPITLFIYLYLFAFVLYHKDSYLLALAFVAFYTLVNFLVTRYMDMTTLNGSIAYLPALLFLILLLFILKKRKKQFTVIIVIFVVSLSLRSIDFMMCDVISFGTHFLWHVFNAVLLYFLLIFLLQSLGKKVDKQ